MRLLKQFIPGAFCALTVLAGGCEEEGRDVLFDEDGTWALLLYDIDGRGLEEFSASSRVDQFMVHFKTNEEETGGIAAAASCIDSMGRTDLTQTLCDVDKFECRCFDYTFEGSAMTFTDRAPKGGEVTDPKTTAVEVAEYEGYSSTYRFEPLPEGLFNSDGEISRYVLQARGNALFMPTGCLDACGIAAEPVEEKK